ncbi:MAG: pectinesterase family protein, partial [Planctomycetota bacterium]
MNAVLEQINSIGKAFVEFAVPMLAQSGVLIVILLLADLVLRKKVKAVFRYCIWMLVLVKLILPTSLSSPLSLGYWFGDKLAYVAESRTSAAPEAEAEMEEPALVNMLHIIETVPIEADRHTPAVLPDIEPAVTEAIGPPMVPVTPVTWQGVVFLVWLAVVIAMGLLLLQRAMFVRGLVAQAKEANALMNDALEYCCKCMGVKRKIGLKVSANAASPAVCGLFRPVILLPRKLAPSLGSRGLRAVLLHELAHIRRRDLWVNLVQTVLQIVYFYNPLLWAANCVIRRVREQAIDETVLVAMGEKAQQYPQTLVNVAKLAFKRPVLSLRLIGVVESKSALAGRIKHILNRPMPKSARLGIISVLVILIAGAVLLPMAKAGRGVVLTVSADGSAEYSSIQEAIDAASAGAVIRIAPGVYKERIKIDKPLTLEGTGWDRTTVTAENNAADVFEEIFDKRHKELLARISMKKMLEATTEKGRKAIEAEFEAEFRAICKGKFNMQTILVSDTKGVVIRGLKVSAPGRHIEGHTIAVPIVRFSNAEAKMYGCVLTGCPGDGIHVIDGSDLEIRDCLVGGLWSTGIVVGEDGSASSRVRILDSDVRNCYYAGIWIRAGNKPAEIKRCRVSGSAWHGIIYSDNSPTIEGNAVFGNARIGIGASYTAAGIVRRNIIYGNEIGGMSCSYQSRPIVKGNTFANNKESGLRIFGDAKPVVLENIFFAHPTAVFCGDFGGEPSKSDGKVMLEENIFWDNERKAVWQHLATGEQEVTTDDIPLDKEAGNIEVDPLFANVQSKDFSLRANSPALRSRIGVAEPLAFYSPWPLQEEELAIIPEVDTRNYQYWKHQGESPPMAKTEKDAAVQPASLEHFIGKYAMARHPDTAAFEITKKGDVFIFSDLGGPKFEMDIILRGLEGRKFEMEKGRDDLRFGDSRRDRFRVWYKPSENRYILDGLGMRGEVQDGFTWQLTELVKISAEKPEESDVRGGVEKSISPKLVMLLGAINSCAAETKLNIELISITTRKINIEGDTSSRTNTQKFLDAIKKNELEILQLNLDTRDGRDKFRIIVEPKKNWQQWWQQHKTDVHVGIEETISPILVMLRGAINSCAAETNLNIESIFIKSGKISIAGDTSGRTNTQKFLDAIRKNELEILQYRVSARDKRDKFSIVVEPKKELTVHTSRPFSATLANGVTVELVGVTNHYIQSERPVEQAWWSANGLLLQSQPYTKLGWSATTDYRNSNYEFAIRIDGQEEYTCAAETSLSRSRGFPRIPKTKNDESLPNMRAFIGEFRKEDKEGNIRFGVATGPWQEVESWKFRWASGEAHNATIVSESALVLEWPRQHGNSVVVEITHKYTDRDRQLLVIDKDGKTHPAQSREGVGTGVGLTRDIYRFDNLDRKDMEVLKFEERPYEWVEFKNVSLQPGLKTDVQVEAVRA